MNFWKQIPASESRAIRWYDVDNTVQEFSYFEVIEAAKQFEVILNSIHTPVGSKSKLLAIVISHCASIVPIIIACLNCSTTFGCINPNKNLQDIVESADRFGADLLVVDVNEVNYDEFIEFCQIEVLGKKLKFILNTPVEKRKTSDDEELMFWASTSGSTSQPKLIGVTFSSFMSNIFGLSRLYHLTSSDLVYVSSPPTFDPFILDICLALSCGATIVMACREVRLDAQHLLEALFPSNGTGVSIMQITPSLFKRWNDQAIKTVILAPSSSLRCLIFGGEPVPCVTDLKRWKDWTESRPTKQRIFNIYGCTEQSCWTSIHEISQKDILAGSIPLGVPIDNMDTLVIKDVETGNELLGDGLGELYLIGRYCHRSGECDSSSRAVQTGDIVERVGSAVYFHSRLDDVVKRYGTKIQLRTIETNAKLVPNVLEACCVFDKQTQTLILFIVLREVIADALSVVRQVRAEQQGQHIDYIKILPCLPLSYHDKVSRSKLLEIHRKQLAMQCSKTPSDFFMEQLKQMLQMNIEIDRTNEKETDSNEEENSWREITFRHAGGTSFMALNLLTALESTFNKPFSRCMGMLLDERQALKGVLNYLEEFNNHNDIKDPIYTAPKTMSFTPVWHCNLDKCIDAAPTVCNLPGFGVLISCGSHSRRLVNVCSTGGLIISELLLPNRIESQVSQHQGNLGLVGCYDGQLYCFELRTGTVRWQFDSGDMIKCRALVMQSTIIFGNYGAGHNLWGLCAETGILRWSSRIGQNSIYASPCRLGDTNKVLICSLDGTYVRISCDTGKHEWTRKMKTPIFSSPRQLLDWDRIVVAEVGGTVHCIDFEGLTLWECTVGGNVFSSFEIIDAYDANCEIVFGCYDRNVYCLQVSKQKKDEYSVAWRCSMDSQIFATPILWEEKFVLGCSTNGQMAIIRWRDGTMIGTYNVNGEIFSSPAVCDGGRAFVGCRNNNLYCFQLRYD